MEILIGGADQREVMLIRNRETDAAIGVLEDVAAIMRIEPRHHDVAALHQPDAPRLRCSRPRRAARASHTDRRHSPARAPRPWRAALQRQVPHTIRVPGADAARARADVGTARRGIARVKHHEPRVIHPAVGILEAARELRPQRRRLQDPHAGPASACPAGFPGRQGGRRGTVPARISHHGRSPA